MPIEFRPPAPPSPPPSPGHPPETPIERSVVLSQAALFAGAVVSTIACATVVVKYVRHPSVRRPPLSLLFWRTLADMIFSLQFLLTLFVQLSVTEHEEAEKGVFWGRLPKYQTLCTAFAGVTQFFAFASEMWLLMICVDLLLSLTQPFRPLASNTPQYHALVWASSLATSACLLGFRLQGPSAIHICWVATDNKNYSVALPDSECGVDPANWDIWSRPTLANWTLFYGWVLAILAFCLFVVAFATARLSEGLQATYEIRLSTIKDLRLYVGTGLVYWAVAATCYLLLLWKCYPEWTDRKGGMTAAVLWSLMGLTIALKGLVDSVLFHTTSARFVRLDRERARSTGRSMLDESARATETADGGGGGKAAANAPFGVPEALREEWLDYTQLGIRKAVAFAEEAGEAARPLKRVIMLPSIREGVGSSRTPSALNSPRASFAAESMTAPLRAQGCEEAYPVQEVHDLQRATDHDADDAEFTPCATRCCRVGWRRKLITFFAGGGPPFQFEEFHPTEVAFRELRQACGVSSADYLASLISGGQVWVRRTKEGKGGRWRFSEGKSGSFM